MVIAGAALGVVPISIQFNAIRLLDVDAQVAIALSISVAAFVSALLNAWIIEARLGDPGASTMGTRLPSWVSPLGMVGAILLAFAPSDWRAACVGIPLLMAALQLQRSHAIDHGLGPSELRAATLVLSGAVSSGIAALAGIDEAFILLAIGCLSAVLSRGASASSKDYWPVNPRIRIQIGAETAVAASSPLIVNIVVLAALGEESAVAFRLVISLLGLLQPLIGYTRSRLLGRDSPRLLVVATALSFAVLGAILLAHIAGVFDAIFATAWDQISVSGLLIACFWKLATIPSTSPFALLRRAGKAGTVLGVRIVVSMLAITFPAALVSVTFSLEGVFAGLLVSELIALSLYLGASRRLRPPNGA